MQSTLLRTTPSSNIVFSHTKKKNSRGFAFRITFLSITLRCYEIIAVSNILLYITIETTKFIPSNRKSFSLPSFSVMFPIIKLQTAVFHRVKSWLKGTKYFKIDLTRSQPAIHSFEWCFFFLHNPQHCYYTMNFSIHFFFWNFIYSLDLVLRNGKFLFLYSLTQTHHIENSKHRKYFHVK